MAITKWTSEIIKLGIDRYLLENGSLPTAWDFDKTLYLPSARQVQRSFGGLESLRRQLGYEELNYTKGELRKQISITSQKRGVSAEDYLEPLLMQKFGEPYVHTQKKYYKKLKNRYDFFIYAKDSCFGVDVFTTNRIEYIGPNIRHKLQKYKDVPSDIDIYFVVVGDTLTPNDVEIGKKTALSLKFMPNIKVMHEAVFLKTMSRFEPLITPNYFKSALE